MIPEEMDKAVDAVGKVMMVAETGEWIWPRKVLCEW
jgi:hypothetical protein